MHFVLYGSICVPAGALIGRPMKAPTDLRHLQNLFLLKSVLFHDTIAKSASSVRKEVNLLYYITSLFISIVAGVISYYICKWIDRK